MDVLDDRQACPICGVTLDKLAERPVDGRIWPDSITYKCTGCGNYWVDRFDGTEMQKVTAKH